MMTRSKCPTPNRRCPSSRIVDQSHHGRIGAHEDPPLRVFLRNQIDRCCIGEMFLESIHCLIHQGDTIGEKEHAFGPITPHEQIAERYHRTCLARPVAITTSAFRSWSRSKASAIRRMLRVW